MLAICYVDPFAHAYAAIALEHLDQPSRGAHHETASLSLLNCMFEGADGASFESAIPVILISQEYQIMSITGYESYEQQFLERDDDTFDVHHAASAET